MSRILRGLFEIVWKAVVGLFGSGGYDSPSAREFADAQTNQTRSVAEVGANPTDRLLAQSNDPPADWDRQLQDLMRSVGARLR